MVFAEIESRTGGFHLKAGGKYGNAVKSDGEVIKLIRQVRPQLEPQQVKALLGGSPKLLKAVHNNVQGKQLLGQIMHEEKRQGLVPKLGMKNEVEKSQTAESYEGWKQVDRN
eukprot:1532145-Amphidinium_carterae.3